MQHARRLYLLYVFVFIFVGCTAVDASVPVPQDSVASANPSVDHTAQVDSTAVSTVPMLVHKRNDPRYEVYLVDPRTGGPASASLPFELAGSVFVPPNPVTADGEHVVLVETGDQLCEPYAGGVACRTRADILHLLDLRTHHQITSTISIEGWVGALSVNPQSNQLALVLSRPESSALALYAMEAGTLLAERTLDFRAAWIHYVLDGAALAIYGQSLSTAPGMTQPSSPRLLVVDVETLEVLWDESLAAVTDGHWCLEKCDAPHGEQIFVEIRPALVPSYDGRRLYIAHADQPQLTRIDFERQTIDTLEIWEKKAWLERLLTATAKVARAKGPLHSARTIGAFSAEQSALIVATQKMAPIFDAHGNWQDMQSEIDLQMLDVESGRILARRTLDIDEPWIDLGEFSVLPEAGALALNGMNMSNGAMWTEVLDAATLVHKARLDWWLSVTRRADGHTLVTGSRHTGPTLRTVELALLHPHSLEVVHTWTVEGHASWLTPK